MSSINFQDTLTHLPAHWANDVDALVYDVFSGAQTLQDARNALGLGTLGLQSKNSVQIDGGVINNVNIGLNVVCQGAFSTLTVQNDPLGPNDATPRRYVDDGLAAIQPIVAQSLAHIGNNNIHVTPSQKAMLDGLIVGSLEINMLQGITGNIQAQIDAFGDPNALYVNVSGDVMTGDLGIQKANPSLCWKNTDTGNSQCIVLRKEGATEYFYLGFNAVPNSPDPVTVIGAFASRVIIGSYTDDDGVTDVQIHRDMYVNGNITIAANNVIDLQSTTKIINVPMPVNPADVATKDYVDNASSIGPTAAPVQDAMDLVAVPQASVVDKQMRLAENQGSIYRYDAQSTDAPSGTDVIQPAFGIGRWFKMSTAIPAHNGLTGLQGGVSGELYHLTMVEHNYLTTLVSQAVPVSYFGGLTANIQAQLDTKLDALDFGAATLGDTLRYDGTNWGASSTISIDGSNNVVINANEITLSTQNQARIHLSQIGELRLGPANDPGIAGQVLTSQGPGSPAVWQNTGASVLAYEHSEVVAATVWTISHNQGSERHVISIYDNAKKAIIPDEIEIIDANTIQVTFSTAQAGRAFVVFF